MADYTYCAVEIGGKIPADVLDELIEAAENDGIDTIDPFEYPDKGGRDVRETFEEAQRRNTYVSMSASEVSGGYCDEIAALCKAHGIPYRQTSAEKYDIPNEIEWFDGEVTRQCPATSSHAPAIEVSDLKTALETGVSLEKLYATHRGFLDALPPVEIISA